MKYIGIAAVVICLGILSACRKSTNSSEALLIPLHECSGKGFNNGDMRLCFEMVISDSRCPINANCVWSGTAIAQFSLQKYDARLHEFTLSTVPLPGSYSRDTIVAGYKIEFVNLHPYPGTFSAPVPDSEIKAEVKITRL